MPIVLSSCLCINSVQHAIQWMVVLLIHRDIVQLIVCPKPKARRRLDTKKREYMCVLDNFENYEINKTIFK